jgi:UMP-CMP kinase
MSKYLAFIVLGGPGSGKGTHCAKLAETFGYLHISAGDLLRAEVQSASPTSTLINSYIRDGKIVPSEITVGLLKKAIDTSTADTVLVDGFPRALDQIDEFNRMCATDCAFVLFFDCPEDLLMTRLIKRGETSGRADDNAESIKKRFVTYREQSYPVIEKYDGMGKVKRVDSSVGTIDEVFSQVRSLFEPSILSGTAATAPRPPSAHGTFLRILPINDVYTLENYPHFASAVVAARKAAADLDCKVISTLNGDFLSPCVLTALDGGRAMVQGLNLAEADYVGLGNHELDLGYEGLNARLSETKPTVINSNLVSVQDKAISNDVAPNFATIQIGERWAVMGGFVTDDMSIYAPFLKPKILPVDECLNVAWNSGMTSLRASKQIGSTALPDLFIPMTHQLTPQDRTTVRMMHKFLEYAFNLGCLTTA